MSHIIIDRRKNDKAKSTINRNRYLRRVKEAVKDAVRDLVRDGDISDTLSGKDKHVKIKRRSLDQPSFHNSQTGGIRDHVYPGNEDFIVGDKIKRPKGGDDGDGDGEGAGESSEDFEFTISQQEFMDIFFDNLYLPDMVKKDVATIFEYENKRAGFSTEGNPSRLNVVRSMKQSMARTTALVSAEEEELEELQKKLAIMLKPLPPCSDPEAKWIDENVFAPKLQKLQVRIQELKDIIRSVPFIDDVDLRYNRWEKKPTPSTQAVVFGIRDVSGSMGEWERDMAKRFFVLMIMFLKRKYERVVFVPIIHTTDAKEVTEQEFFACAESGGTLISTAYEVMANIQKERFPESQWNIFGVQISDGDDVASDIPVCVKYMKNVILPVCQYYAYVETKKQTLKSIAATLFGGQAHSDIYSIFSRELVDQKNFVASVIGDAADIYPVFRKLFEKKDD